MLNVSEASDKYGISLDQAFLPDSLWQHSGRTLSPWVFVSGKPFQPSLMFQGKAGAYPSEAPFRCSTLG
jgi:hypothetical protein